MKLFSIKVQLPATCVQRFARGLTDHGRHTGVTLSSFMRDSDDADTDDRPIVSFVCQASATLDPDQLTVLMVLCKQAKATILAMAYTDVDESAEASPPPKLTCHRHVPPSPVRLVAENGQPVDRK